MENYYIESKYGTMAKMMNLIGENADSFLVEKQLEKMFDFLSGFILDIGEKIVSYDIFLKLDNLFVSIKEKLESDEAKEQITVLKYNEFVDKYNQAIAYVKSAYI